MDFHDIHPISDLVGSFLEAAQTVLRSHDPEVLEAIPAELTYELDQIISGYLEAHQIEPVHFQQIQQDVVNSLAQSLLDEGSLSSETLVFDDYGNVDLSDVVASFDQLHHPFGPESLDHGVYLGTHDEHV